MKQITYAMELYTKVPAFFVGENTQQRRCGRRPTKASLIDLRPLAKGVYHLKVFEEDQLSNFKIIIQ